MGAWKEQILGYMSPQTRTKWREIEATSDGLTWHRFVQQIVRSLYPTLNTSEWRDNWFENPELAVAAQGVTRGSSSPSPRRSPPPAYFGHQISGRHDMGGRPAPPRQQPEARGRPSLLEQRYPLRRADDPMPPPPPQRQNGGRQHWQWRHCNRNGVPNQQQAAETGPVASSSARPKVLFLDFEPVEEDEPKHEEDDLDEYEYPKEVREDILRNFLENIMGWDDEDREDNDAVPEPGSSIVARAEHQSKNKSLAEMRRILKPIEASVDEEEESDGERESKVPHGAVTAASKEPGEDARIEVTDSGSDELSEGSWFENQITPEERREILRKFALALEEPTPPPGGEAEAVKDDDDVESCEDSEAEGLSDEEWFEDGTPEEQRRLAMKQFILSMAEATPETKDEDSSDDSGDPDDSDDRDDNWFENRVTEEQRRQIMKNFVLGMAGAEPQPGNDEDSDDGDKSEYETDLDKDSDSDEDEDEEGENEDEVFGFNAGDYHNGDDPDPLSQPTFYSFIVEEDPMDTSRDGFRIMAYWTCDEVPYPNRSLPVHVPDEPWPVYWTHPNNGVFASLPKDGPRGPSGLGKRPYKSALLKVKPVNTQMPEEYCIIRCCPSDPMQSLPRISATTSDFVPTKHMTEERMRWFGMDNTTHLWPEERCLFKNVLVANKSAFA